MAGTVKYEEVYLKEYRAMSDARLGLDGYFPFYNQERLHQSLNYKTPLEIYRQGLKNKTKSATITTLY